MAPPKKIYLSFVSGLVAFLSGLGVMVTELGIVRLASPIVGSSQPVWAITIASVLGAVALGNMLGGYLAKQDSLLRLVSFSLFLAAFLTILLPFLVSPLLLFLLSSLPFGFFWTLLGLAGLAFFSTFPLGLLSPLLIREHSSELIEVGPITGQVQALSTLGALFGTLGSTFITIPFFGTKITFFLSGSALFLSSLLIERNKKTKYLSFAFILSFLILLFFPPSFSSHPWGKRLDYIESPYGNWEVVEDSNEVRYLVAGDGSTIQSYYDPRGLQQGGPWPAMSASPLLAQCELNSPSRVYIIGVSGGSTLREIIQTFPLAQVEGCEIDPVALKLGKQYLHFPQERCSIEVSDGRIALSQTKGTFDAILVDAYQGVYIPFHLVTKEFLILVQKRLKPKGVFMINLLSAKNWELRGFSKKKNTSDEGPLVQACVQTAAEIFPYVYLWDLKNGLNTLLIGSFYPLSNDFLMTQALGLKKRNPSLGRYLANSFPHIRLAQTTPNALVLSDDRAPVAWLTHKLALHRLFSGKCDD